MGRTGPKLTPEQRTQIEERAWHLRVTRGWSQSQIAKDIARALNIEVDRSTVSRALAKVRKQAIKRLDALAEQTLVEQTAQSDLIYGMALKGWRGENNPQYLQAALAAMKHKADILHLKVIRLEHTGKDGGPIDVTDAKERLAQLIARHAEREGAGGDPEPTE